MGGKGSGRKSKLTREEKLLRNREYMRKWNKEHPEAAARYKTKNPDYWANYVKKNEVKLKAYWKNYYNNKPDGSPGYGALYFQANKEWICAKARAKRLGLPKPPKPEK